MSEMFEPFQEVLRSRYEGYAPFFDPDVIIEVLFSVGFLGVRRSDRYLYWGTTETPVMPYESEFCLHPCFRPSLGASRPVADSPHNVVTGEVVGTAYQVGVVSGDIHFGSSYDGPQMSDVENI